MCKCADRCKKMSFPSSARPQRPRLSPRPWVFSGSLFCPLFQAEVAMRVAKETVAHTTSKRPATLSETLISGRQPPVYRGLFAAVGAWAVACSKLSATDKSGRVAGGQQDCSSHIRRTHAHALTSRVCDFLSAVWRARRHMRVLSQTSSTEAATLAGSCTTCTVERRQRSRHADETTCRCLRSLRDRGLDFTVL